MSCIHNTGGCPVDVLKNCEYRAICQAAEEQKPRIKIDADKLIRIAAWVTLFLTILAFSYLGYLGYLEVHNRYR